MFLVNWPHLTLCGVWVIKNEVLCVHMDISLKMPLTNLAMGVGLAKHYSDKYFILRLEPKPHMLGGNPYHSWENQVLITPYRESNSCVLEIIFGGFLQISWATICTWGISSRLPSCIHIYASKKYASQMPHICYLCQLLHVHIYVSIYTSNDITAIHNETKSTDMHTFHITGLSPAQLCLTYCTYMSHCTSTAVHI